MAELHHSVVIDRPPSRVFQYVSNFDNFEAWQTLVTGIERMSSARMAVGTEYTASGQAMGRQFTVGVVVTRLEPDRLLAFRTTGGPLEGESTLRFEAVEGGTKVSLHGQARLAGAYKLLEPILAQQAQEICEADLARLKQCLESEP